MVVRANLLSSQDDASVIFEEGTEATAGHANSRVSTYFCSSESLSVPSATVQPVFEGCAKVTDMTWSWPGVDACPADHVTPTVDSIGSSSGAGQYSQWERERGRTSVKAIARGPTRKPIARSGSLPPLDPVQPSATKMAVPRLSLEPVRMDTPITPAPLGRTDSWMSVGSCRRMNGTPRLPPIGGSDHVMSMPVPPSSRSPKRSPRELETEATGIDPVLYDNADPTDVRLLGRRRNAVVTSTPRGDDTPA